jgi:hypothetical protein
VSNERGPIYWVPLIETLPLGTGIMRQQMASLADLNYIRQYSERMVAAYEVALAHLADREEEVKLLKGTIAALESMRQPKVIDGSGS